MFKKLERLFVTLIAILVILGCSLKIYDYYNDKSKSDVSINQEEIVTKNEEPEIIDDTESNTITEVDPEPTILQKYEDLYNRNNDMIGYIYVPETNINYPIMNSIDNDP